MDVRAASGLPELAVVRAERRRISVLFADLVGSTDLMERLGAEGYQAALRFYHSICTEAVRSHGGTVAQYQGDGIMCFFGYPVANEDDPARAVLAALDLLEALAAGNRGHDPPIHARVGIATGAAIVARDSGQFGGEAVGACLNLASRLQDQAGPDGIAVCEDTVELIGEQFRTRSLGLRTIKGFTQPKPVSLVLDRARGVVTRFAAHHARGETPLVGRQDELRQLQQCFSTVGEGKGHSLAIIGSAGLGKSRLTQAFLASEDMRGVPSFVLQCAPEYAFVSLYPVRSYLDWISGVRRDDDEDARREKLARLFSIVWQADAEETALLLDLVASAASDEGGDPEETVSRRRQRAFAVLARRMFGALGRARAFVLVFEDIHWIDPTSLELLAYLARHVRDFPLLLLCTSRPESGAVAEANGFDAHIMLQPLSPEEATDLAVAASAHYHLEERTIRKITDLAEGVPLFVEEYARLIGRTRDQGPNAPRLPLTLSGIVLSKFDRLTARGRAFAQAAAVLGRQFDACIAASMCDVPEVQPVLQALLDEQLLSRVSGDEAEFAHALIRDGIYDTLDAEGRWALHQRAAAAIEDRLGGNAPAAILASHYAQAGETLKAVAHYRMAARAAAGSGAVAEALASLNSAIEQIETLEQTLARDRLELEVRAVQGPALMVLQGPGSPEFGATQERALSLLERLDIQEARAPVIFHTALHSWAIGRYADALLRVDALDALAERDGDDDGLSFARKTMRGVIAWHQGRTGLAEALLGETVSAYDPSRHASLYGEYLMEFGVFGRFYLALAKTVLGKVEEGAALAADAARVARIVRFPHARGFAQLAQFMCALLREDVALCREHAARAEKDSAAQGFPEFVAMARFALGWAASQQGDHATGIPLMRDGVERWDRTGFTTWQPIFAALLAEAELDAGLVAQAQRSVREADASVDATGEEQACAPLLAVRARLALLQGDQAGGEEIARRALATSKTQASAIWRERIVRHFPAMACG